MDGPLSLSKLVSDASMCTDNIKTGPVDKCRYPSWSVTPQPVQT